MSATYLQQLLQQEAHLPSAHLAQAEQVVLQHLAQAPSAAEAAARPNPAMRAIMAPALIMFFMDVSCVGDGRKPFPSCK